MTKWYRFMDMRSWPGEVPLRGVLAKEFSNNQFHPWPVAWLVLECGHTAKADYDYSKDACLSG